MPRAVRAAFFVFSAVYHKRTINEVGEVSPIDTFPHRENATYLCSVCLLLNIWQSKMGGYILCTFLTGSYYVSLNNILDFDNI
jgi:hypothetical protein